MKWLPRSEPARPAEPAVRIGSVPALAAAFQTRHRLCERIDRARAGHPVVVLTQVLAGGGGVGKSQLAAAYAHQALADGCEVVVWVNAADAGQVPAVYAQAARVLREPAAARAGAGLAEGPDPAVTTAAAGRRTRIRGAVGVDAEPDARADAETGADAGADAEGDDEGAIGTDSGTAAYAEVEGAAEADARAFLDWLATTPRSWLVVLDDITDPDALARWWPPVSPTGGGRVIATARCRDAAPAGEGRAVVDIGTYTAAEAVGYLRGRLTAAGRPHLLDDRVTDLAERLGRHPLALSYAAAYMINVGARCAEYLELHAARTRRPAAPPAADPGARPDRAASPGRSYGLYGSGRSYGLYGSGRSYESDRSYGLYGSYGSGRSAPYDRHGRRVAAAVGLALDAAQECDPVGLAVPALRLAAVLDPAGHPQALWTGAAVARYLGEASGAPVDAGEARAAVRLLHRYGLLTADHRAGPRAVRIHPVTARLARTATTVAAEPAPAEPAPADGAAPDVDAAPAGRGRPGADTDAAPEDGRPPDERERDGGDGGEGFGDGGGEGEGFGEGDGGGQGDGEREGERSRDDGGGPPDAAVAAALPAAADAVLELWPEAGPPDAEPCAVLRANAVVLAAHPDPALWSRGVHPLLPRAGRSMLDAGLYRAAIAYWQHLGERAEETLGPEHHDTLALRSGLAVCYSRAGFHAEAVDLKEQVLADRMRLFGPDDPASLAARADLAATYLDLNRFSEGVALLEEVVAAHERAHGADARAALGLRAALAASLWAAGRTEDALAAEEEVLDTREELLGRDHPDTLDAAAGLGATYRALGRFHDAIALQERVAAARARLLGAEHPDTLLARAALARSYWSAGRREEAVALRTEVAAAQERVLGPEHAATLRSWSVLADWTARPRKRWWQRS